MKQIGVVIPVYNGEKSIEKSIKSLLYQTYKDWVAIIVNDGSTDKTKKILDAYSNDIRFYITHFDKNRGRPIARQKGLEVTRELGLEYMCMLDADDWYYPDKLSYQFDIMEQNQDLLLLSSSIGVTSKTESLYKVIAPFRNFKIMKFEKYSNFIMIPHASSMINMQNIKGDINYDIKLKLSEDKDFLRRILKGNHYAFDPKILYVYNRENSFSIEKYKESMYYNYLSFKGLKPGTKANLLYQIKNITKYSIVWFLSILKIQNIYLSRVGVNPNQSELIKYEENRNQLA